MLASRFVSAPYIDLPLRPIRVIPRNVVMQRRWWPNAATGTFEIFLKPRITTDESVGSEESHDPNSGVSRAETAVRLPHTRHFGLGSAVVATICDLAGIDTAMIT